MGVSGVCVCVTCLVWPGARFAAVAVSRERDPRPEAKMSSKTNTVLTSKPTWHFCLFIFINYFDRKLVRMRSSRAEITTVKPTLF